MIPNNRLGLDTVKIEEIMAELSYVRPIFHSEADFQHALAWQIHKVVPEFEVRLEYKPIPHERMYVDLWLSLSGNNVVLELKYMTQMLNHTEVGEDFSLAQQGANDIRRYEFLRDIERLERLAQLEHVSGGFAILLTNDSAYWSKRPIGSAETIDAAFHLYEGRQICGKLAWSERAGRGTTKGREAPIQIGQQYELRWRKYGVVGTGKHQEFRYLLVHVQG